MGDENRLFRQFEANLRMTPATVSAVRNRYHAITRRINVDFWGTSSDTDHSWYAGSYGRDTAISTSDIDILVELPSGEYNNAWAQSLFGGNGPSELLQKVKRSLSATYPQTKLRGDRQVVVAEFTDGVRFEIVPVFRAETQGYSISGRSPLEWIIDHYHVKTDKASGIVNDPNEFLREQGRPDAVVDLIKRLVTVSMRTQELLATLPKLEIPDR